MILKKVDQSRNGAEHPTLHFNQHTHTHIMTKPENTYYNACILKDFKSFAKDGFNMLDDNCDINPKFYDLIEADACGNIIKVNNQPVTQKGTIYFLED